MALVPRSGGTRAGAGTHAVSGYPFYGNIVTDPAAAWTIRGMARLPSSTPRCSSRWTHGSASTAVARLGQVHRDGIAAQRPGRRRDLGGDRTTRLRPRAVRPGDWPRRLRRAAPSTRRCSSSDHAHGDTFVRGFRQRLDGQQRSVQARAYDSRGSPARSTSCTLSSPSSGSSPSCSVASAWPAAYTRSSCGSIDARGDSSAASAPRAGKCSSTRCRRRLIDLPRRRGRCTCVGLGIQFAMPYVLHDSFGRRRPRLAPRPVRWLGDQRVGGAACSRCVRWSRCVEMSPLQALRRVPDADALRARAGSAAHRAVAGDQPRAVLALRLSRANTPAAADRHSRWRSPALSAFSGSARQQAVVGRAAVDSTFVAVPAAPGSPAFYRPG